VLLNSCKFSVSGEATKRFTPIKRDEQKVAPPVSKTNPKASSLENKKQSKEEANKEVEQKQNPMPGKDKPETKAKVAEQPKPVQTEKVSSIATKVEETNKASESKPKEKSANGISFRIQLAASSEKSPIDKIASRFNLKAADVREELHNDDTHLRFFAYGYLACPKNQAQIALQNKCHSPNVLALKAQAHSFQKKLMFR
jgi:septal ring-binding cell division protein DamX